MRSSVSFWLGAATLFLLTSTSANADSALAKATLSEIDKDGHEINTTSSFSLTEYAKGKSKRPSYFSFTEDRNIVCIQAPCPSAVTTDFKIKAISKDSCGSTVFVAQNNSRGNRLTVLDHSTRVCDDVQKYRWQVSLVGPRYSKRLFQGNDLRSVASDSCLSKLENMICITLYAPVDCTASTVDGGKETIEPIKASGSNSCHAAWLIKTQACALGIDPDRFQDGDMKCSPVNNP